MVNLTFLIRLNLYVAIKDAEFNFNAKQKKKKLVKFMSWTHTLRILYYCIYKKF